MIARTCINSDFVTPWSLPSLRSASSNDISSLDLSIVLCCNQSLFFVLSQVSFAYNISCKMVQLKRFACWGLYSFALNTSFYRSKCFPSWLYSLIDFYVYVLAKQCKEKHCKEKQNKEKVLLWRRKLWRRSKCNDYHRRKWRCRLDFKSGMKPFGFHTRLILFGKCKSNYFLSRHRLIVGQTVLFNTSMARKSWRKTLK